MAKYTRTASSLPIRACEGAGQPNITIALMDIAMMTFAGEARQRTTAEYQELFAAAGLSLVGTWPTNTEFTTVEASVR